MLKHSTLINYVREEVQEQIRSSLIFEEKILAGQNPDFHLHMLEPIL